MENNNRKEKKIGSKVKHWKEKKRQKRREQNVGFIDFLKNHGLEKYTEQLLTIKDWTVTIVYAIVLATIFKSLFYENSKIPSGSMNPLLLNGDRVLVNKWYYGYSKFSFPFHIFPIKERVLSNRTPQRGDIVVFHTKFSEKNNIFYVKRIVGLPNDRVQIKGNQVYVNGEAMTYKKQAILQPKSATNHNNFPSMEYTENNGDNEYSVLISDINSIAGNTREYVVPEGYYFCMGDNRDNSHDSRFNDFGMIPFKNIVGKAERIFFSTANGYFNNNRVFKSIKAKEVD